MLFKYLHPVALQFEVLLLNYLAMAESLKTRVFLKKKIRQFFLTLRYKIFLDALLQGLKLGLSENNNFFTIFQILGELKQIAKGFLKLFYPLQDCPAPNLS